VKPDRKADENQVARMFAGGHDDLDLAERAYPLVQKVAKEMGKGSSSSLGAVGGGGSEGSPVERQAFSLTFDPGLGGEAWLTEGVVLLNSLASWANRVHRLVPHICWRKNCGQFGKPEGCATHKVGMQSRGRENQVELCARCGSPEPDVHRIDGQPYCKKGRVLPTGEWQPACYDAERRDRQKAG